MLLHVLIATQAPGRDQRLARLLAEEPVLLAMLSPGADLLARLRGDICDLVLVDAQRLAAGGISLSALRGQPWSPEVVAVTVEAEPGERTELQAEGAYAVIDMSASPAELASAFHAIVQRRTSQARIELAAPEVYESKLGDFSTASPAMREFLALVRKVVDTDSTLLVQGETGVGKEYLSRAIHAEGPRSSEAFVPVNCSALSETLLESELFGHVEGAFTGASRARRGYFEMAHSGTLFLDEIGELSPHLQVKLLRVLQNRRIQPVGAEQELEVDVRLIAASNRDLVQEMKAGRFRADLFYRLSVVTLQVPPLRMRHEDIPAMVESHIEHFRFALNRPVHGIDDEALSKLVEYEWPGNVRELINVIERAVLLCAGEEIQLVDLPYRIREPERARSTVSSAPEPREEPPWSEDRIGLPYDRARQETLDAFDRAYLEALLTRCHGRIGDASDLSSLSTRSLYEKMRRLGIRKEFFRPGKLTSRA